MGVMRMMGVMRVIMLRILVHDDASPPGLAFDGSSNMKMVVVEYGSHRIHILKYSDGSHVRVVGKRGSSNGHFHHPFGGVVVDKDGCMVVCDTLNHRVEVLR